MTLSSQRGQGIREYLPSIFEKKKHLWPNPQGSIGEKCPNINSQYCWQVVGPALRAMGELAPSISELLQKHQELLEQGESKHVSMSFHMWMVGHTPVSAHPTIVFISKSKRKRTYARALLKDSSIMAKYPGIQIKTLDKIPAFHTSAEHPPRRLSNTPMHENSVYMIDESRRPCGALIGFGSSKTATLGGILIINGVHYGMSAQHARYQSLTEQREFDDNRNPPCFDDDSDIESEDFMEYTSKASVSSCDLDIDSFEISSTDSSSDFLDPQESEDLDLLTSAWSDNILDSPRMPRLDTQVDLIEQDVACHVPSKAVPGRRISSLSSDYVVNDLDYEVFELEDAIVERCRNIPYAPLAEDRDLSTAITSPKGIVRNLAESKVWAVTGTTGLIRGTIFRSPYYTQLEGSCTFQEMWAVKFDRKPMQGDSGAWVIDAVTGALYGHVVAGDPATDMAFVIPAYKVFDDLELRFGTKPLISMKPTANSRDVITNLDKSRKQLVPSINWNFEAILRLVTMCFVLNCHEPTFFSILSSPIFSLCLESLHVLADPMDLISLYFGDEIFHRRFWRLYCPTSFFYDTRLFHLDGCTGCWMDFNHDIEGQLDWAYHQTNLCFPKPVDMQVYKRLLNLPPTDYRQQHQRPAKLLEFDDSVVSDVCACSQKDVDRPMQGVGSLAGHHDLHDYCSSTETDSPVSVPTSDVSVIGVLADEYESTINAFGNGVCDKCSQLHCQVASTVKIDDTQSQKFCCQNCGHPILGTATINTQDGLSHLPGNGGSLSSHGLDCNELESKSEEVHPLSDCIWNWGSAVDPFAEASIDFRTSNIEDVAWNAPASPVLERLAKTYRSSTNGFNRADLFKRHIASVHGTRDGPLRPRRRTFDTLTATKEPFPSTYARKRCPSCSNSEKTWPRDQRLTQVSRHSETPHDMDKWLVHQRRDPPAAMQDSDIAVVGMSGRFPDADDTRKLWEMLEEGLDAHREVPLNHYSVEHDTSPGKNPKPFDAQSFNMYPRETGNTDPLQRLLIGTVYEAMEIAGIVPEHTDTNGVSIKVFAPIRCICISLISVKLLIDVAGANQALFEIQWT